MQLARIDTSVGGDFRQPIASSALPSAMSPHFGIPRTPHDEAGLTRRQQNALKGKKKLDAKSQANKVRVVDLGVSSVWMISADVPQIPVELTPYPITQESNGVKVEDYFSLDTKSPSDETKIAVEFTGPKALPSPIVQTSGEGFGRPLEGLCELLYLTHLF